MTNLALDGEGRKVMKKRRQNSINELAKHGRMRNRLLMAKTLQTEVRAAAARVVRLSDPGTPERLVTLMAVADDTGLPITAISDELTSKGKP